LSSRHLGLMGNFGFVFPVPAVNGLREGTKFPKSLRFPNAGNLILDSVREPVVEMMSESTFAITLDLGCKVIELHHVLVDVLAILHREMVKLVFSVTNRIMGSEIGLELEDEFPVIVHPVWAKHWVAQLEEIGLKPLESHSFEVGLGKGNLCLVSPKSAGRF
jgi:hypothetical protein